MFAQQPSTPRRPVFVEYTTKISLKKNTTRQIYHSQICCVRLRKCVGSKVFAFAKPGKCKISQYNHTEIIYFLMSSANGSSILCTKDNNGDSNVTNVTG